MAVSPPLYSDQIKHLAPETGARSAAAMYAPLTGTTRSHVDA